MSGRAIPPHSIRSLLPPLQVLEAMGFARATCLKGTGILQSELEHPKVRISLQQELAFYRNALELTDDPLVGLKLGEPFLPARYGLYGYALLSASTLRHALSFAAHFSQLTFSFFAFEFKVQGKQAAFLMSRPPDIEQALVDLYTDRDISAARVAISAALGRPFPLDEVHLTHAGHGRQQAYRDYFGCQLSFDSDRSGVLFSSGILDEPLPHSDPESAQHLQRQCQMMIAQLSQHSHFIDDVRMLVLGRPGYFPDIEYVAEKLSMSVRTLRRRLLAEGSSYRALLDEIRYGLARDYLVDSRLPMEEIAGLLGYSEPGNFSHAFRRWSGESPRSWREGRRQI